MNTRILLTEMPRLHPHGLPVYPYAPFVEARYTIAAVTPDAVIVLSAAGQPMRIPGTSAFIDAADPETADRLVRYVAAAAGFGVGGWLRRPLVTPPLWLHVPGTTTWRLQSMEPDGHGLSMLFPAVEHPELGELRPGDDTLAPCGARVVDLAALVVVARRVRG